jgi:hypothetical protein
MNTTHKFTRKSAIAAVVSLVVAGALAASPAHAANTPTEGGACETLGAHAEGTALDCVVSPGGQTWRTKGTRLNPYRLGETATISRFVGAAWKPSYKITITGGNPDATADVTIQQPAVDRKVVPAGWRPVTAGVVITLLGSKPAPSSGLRSFFVDSANQEYALFAYKKGELDCTMAFIKQANEAKLSINQGTITGNVCSFVPPASINSTLLMRVIPSSIKKGEPRETWFAFLP